ncbi:hypothetical protein NDU88_000753 [Pleurodeles waltl]|uniref:Uncharacterized protein n=1 Tax=Pleurodeles waltl TaxID=8319 RepID=A0AAV7UQX6_PLEWA|nr:hypothetical protein NDU88_000753 [Pleurodeles waltl]
MFMAVPFCMLLKRNGLTLFFLFFLQKRIGAGVRGFQVRSLLEGREEALGASVTRKAEACSKLVAGIAAKKKWRRTGRTAQRGPKSEPGRTGRGLAFARPGLAAGAALDPWRTALGIGRDEAGQRSPPWGQVRFFPLRGSSITAAATLRGRGAQPKHKSGLELTETLKSRQTHPHHSQRRSAVPRVSLDEGGEASPSPDWPSSRGGARPPEDRAGPRKRRGGTALPPPRDRYDFFPQGIRAYRRWPLREDGGALEMQEGRQIQIKGKE